MQRHTFLRTRTKKRIRILPRVPTLQTYSFWPIGVFQRRWLARYCSVPAFFCTDAPRRPLWSRTRKESWVRILCREPGCRWCPFGPRHLKSTFPSNTNFGARLRLDRRAEGALRRPRGARGARDGTLRRARLRGAPGGCACGAGGAARLLQARARPAAAPAPPRLRGLATAPRLAPATPRRRAPPLEASSRVPPVGLGRAGGGRCKGCTWAHILCLASAPNGRRSARLKRQTLLE